MALKDLLVYLEPASRSYAHLELAFDLARIAGRREGTPPVGRLATDRLGRARAELPRDVGVGDCAEEREIDRERR